MPSIAATFSAVDYSVIAVLVLSSGFGFMRGLTREALGLCSWIGAFWGTTVLEPTVRPFVASYVHNSTALSVCSIGSSFLALLLLGALISRGIVHIVQKSALSSIDRTLGLPFGFVRGYLLVSCALLGYIFASGSVLHPAVERAKLLPFVRYGALWVRSFLGSMPNASLPLFLTEREAIEISKSPLSPPREKLEDFVAPRLERPAPFPKRQEENLDVLIQ
jgi:membrane protein required for colicin V production